MSRIFLTLVFFISFVLTSLGEDKPTLIYVTQKNCTPCREAKRVFEALKKEGKLVKYETEELDIQDHQEWLRAIKLNPWRTPSFMILNKKNKFIRSINTNNEKIIRDFISDVPKD